MKITFLGAGKMGGAILGSLIKSRAVKAADITVLEADRARAAALAESLGVRAAETADAALAGARAAFLAVKPQDLGALLAQVRCAEPLFISIAAGKMTRWLEAALPPGARVVRAMPNLALTVGEGMSVVCRGVNAGAADLRLAMRLLSRAGKTLELPEALFDAATALSGSGPAFYAYFSQAMADAGAALGLAPETAEALATQTFLGAALALARGGVSAPEFIKAVASPKGTTAAGLEILGASALRGITADTLAAAARRSAELCG